MYVCIYIYISVYVCVCVCARARHTKNINSNSLLANQNSIHEEIKSRLKAGNSCYYSLQTLLCSKLLSKNLKIENTI